MVYIIRPYKSGYYAQTAAEELQYFLHEMHCETQFADAVPPEGNVFISLGKNRVSQAEKFDLPVLKDVGFSIRTRKGYFILSESEFGILSGVYALLKEIAGIEVIANDETIYGDEICFKPVNIDFEPDINYGERSWLSWCKYNPTYHNRLLMREPHFAAYGDYHSFVNIVMPKDKYYAAHPDWYAESGEQLCLTNEEMTEEFIKNVLAGLAQEDLKDEPTTILRLGHEDTGAICRCEKCRASDEKYGKSGTLMRFINKVARAVNAYSAAHFPDKTIKIVTLAYGPSSFAPVDEQGKPVDPSVVAEPNVCAFICIGNYWGKDKFEYQQKRLRDWQAVGVEPFIWLYDSAFDDEYIYLNTLPHLQDIYKICKEANTVHFLDMGHYLGNISFDQWSNYIRSRLMKDVSADIDALTEHFFKHYYKEASDAVLRYFREINATESAIDNDYGLYTRTSPILRSEKLWKKEQLVSWVKLLSQAAEQVKEEKVRLRVVRERMTPLYLLLEIYADKMQKDELADYIDTFVKDAGENDLPYMGEHGPEIALDLRTKLATWRSLLYQ